MYRCMPSLRVLHPCRRYVCTGHTVSYVTDVEGNLGHWNRWADLSSAVERNKSSQELELNDNCHVVYGGDVWDRGKGDLRIIRDVVSLKKKYPSRVHIILGNRDINKIRLISELNAAEVKKDLHTYWAGRMTVDSSCIPASMADRLRLILERTMGCPHSFEYRRTELQELGIISPGDSEQQQGQKIADSYLEAVRPGGILAEYLRLGSLALLLGGRGDGCLFVHGGLHPHTLGWVPLPGPAGTGKRVDSVQQWVKELQTFHDQEMADLLGNSNVRRTKHDERWLPLYASETVLRHPFTLSSEVTHGFKRGSTELGFPTANLNLESLKITPDSYGQQGPAVDVESEHTSYLDQLNTGVYVGCAQIRSMGASSSSAPTSTTRFYPCVYSVGWNPTYNNTTKTIEVHFLDIDITSTLPSVYTLPLDFYGEIVDVHTLVFLREEHKFEHLDKKNNGSVAVAPTGDTHPTPGLALDSCGEVSTCSEHADTPYIEQPWSTLGGYSSPNAASRLLQYGMGRLPGGVINPTVIYDNFLQEGSPQLPDPTVLQYLADSGITKVFSGHQPHGDSPVVMTAPAAQVLAGGSSSSTSRDIQFFTCDTSYANDVHWTTEYFESSKECLQALKAVEAVQHRVSEANANANVSDSDPHDTRGGAVAEVCLHFEEEPSIDSGCGTAQPTNLPSHVSIRGTLSNSISYYFDVNNCSYVGSSFEVIDTNNKSASTWWIKGHIDVQESDGQSIGKSPKSRIYLACKSEDRDVFNALISEEEVKYYMNA